MPRSSREVTSDGLTESRLRTGGQVWIKVSANSEVLTVSRRNWKSREETIA